MNWLASLGLWPKRRSWQELIGIRPHMIDPDNADAGYGKRKTYDVVNGIAVIDVRGLLINDEDWWDGWGCSTYDRIAEEVRGAAEDSGVGGILLRVNSPGGETDKAFETAADIVAAGKQKPVWAVADTAAYSAGYLLASSASRVYVPPFSGGVGSIGVYIVHMDWSGALEKAGVKATFIEAGKGKTDGHPYKPLSTEAQERIKAEIDRLYTMFVDHVAARRDITAGSIREMGAVIRNGKSAIESGLADKIGSTATALNEMRAYLDKRSSAVLPGFAEAADPAAAAANSTKGGDMAELEVKPADTGTDPAPAARAETPAEDPVVMERKARADVEQILALCAIDGLSAAEAKAFLESRKTPEQVGAEIQAGRAARSEAQPIVSQLQPHTGASAEPTKPEESAIVKAAEKLAQAGRKES